MTRSSTPVEVLGVNEAAAVRAGGARPCAMLVSAGIECWGSNEEGAARKRNIPLSERTPGPVEHAAVQRVGDKLTL